MSVSKIVLVNRLYIPTSALAEDVGVRVGRGAASWPARTGRSGRLPQRARSLSPGPPAERTPATRPESETRRILAFLRTEWEEAMLRGIVGIDPPPQGANRRFECNGTTGREMGFSARRARE